MQIRDILVVFPQPRRPWAVGLIFRGPRVHLCECVRVFSAYLFHWVAQPVNSLACAFALTAVPSFVRGFGPLDRVKKKNHPAQGTAAVSTDSWLVCSFASALGEIEEAIRA